MSQLEAQVGPQTLQDGAPVTLRTAKDATLIVGHGLGRYEELARRGVLLTASTALAGMGAPTAVAAANASPLVAGTGQPILGLSNPVQSGYDLVIMRTKIWTVSGAPGGPFGWNVIPPNSGITVAGTAALRNDTGRADGPACVLSNVALTGSALATMLRGIGGPAAIAAGAGLYVVDEETAGDLVVLPGGFAGIAATAAGTTHIVGASITFALRKNAGP